MKLCRVMTRTCPHTVTFLDLGITGFTSVKVTAAMLLAFSTLPRLPVMRSLYCFHSR